MFCIILRVANEIFFEIYVSLKKQPLENNIFRYFACSEENFLTFATKNEDSRPRARPRAREHGIPCKKKKKLKLEFGGGTL